jgi:hypothetical protein
VSLWLEILQLGAAGESSTAHQLLAFELPTVLRHPEVAPTGGTQYKGPMADAAGSFISTLSEMDRGMATSRFEDFVDYTTELLQSSVRRSLSLVEFCLANPNLSIPEIEDQFAGWDGLKLGQQKRQLWIKKHICSMLAVGIQLPAAIADAADCGSIEDEDLYRFNEIALSKGWEFGRSWRDFKSREEIDTSYLCVADESTEDSQVGDEKTDYGSITTAQVVLALTAPSQIEFLVDFNQMGRDLTADLCNLLERFHSEKPSDGYSPIAWHNVWWAMISRYEAIPLDLEVRDPLCDVDRELAEHISKTYPEVLTPSRLTIFRRRSKFQSECVDRAQALLIAWVQNRV